MTALALCCEPQVAEVELGAETEVLDFDDALVVHGDAPDLVRLPAAACRSTACSRFASPD